MTTKIIDIIPVADSAETEQNSEPSLAVDPNDPTKIIAGAFAGETSFFLTTNGGTTWSKFDNLVTDDKSLAWKADGSGFLTATLTPAFNITTYSGIVSGSGFGSPINIFAPKNPDDLDQPWIRTGPSNHVYVAYNNLNNFSNTGRGKTASINVSTNGGSTFTPVVIDSVGGTSGQDAPGVRMAVSGSTVYAVYTRWNATVEDDATGTRYSSQVIVVRSDNAGADSFTALGTGGAGTIVASPTGLFANTENTPLTLGQERTSSDVAIAVDPDNAAHLLIAYSDAPGANGSGRLQLIVSESTDSGATWTTKFTTSSSTRSAEPALAILTDGTIGFLYDNYDPLTNKLSQHLLQTADDFATTTDSVLATESNSTPFATSDPYLGDFFDLEGFGTTFYGVFSASNADNGTDAAFSNVTFQRHTTGTAGTASFRLTDGNGHNVSASIDPFFFTATDIALPPVVTGALASTLDDFSWAQGWGSADTPRIITDVTGDGTSDYVGFGDQYTFIAYGGTVSNGQGGTGAGFTSATSAVKDFGTSEGYTADMQRGAAAAGVGDGDILYGQGYAGVYWYEATGGTAETGAAGNAYNVLQYQSSPNFYGNFGSRQGWTGDNGFQILKTSSTDTSASILGFGDDGIVVGPQAFASGATAADSYVISFAAGNNSGWDQKVDIRTFTDVDGKPIDLNGDGIADFVGMGPTGLVYAYGTESGGTYGLGSLQTAHVAGTNTDLGEAQGWIDATSLRYVVADPKTGYDDIIAFGAAGVYVSMGQDATTHNGEPFGKLYLAIADFGSDEGWSGGNPRLVGDVTGDGIIDIVGFGDSSTFVAVGSRDSSGNLQFKLDSNKTIGDFGAAEGWSGSSLQTVRALGTVAGTGSGSAHSNLILSGASNTQVWHYT